ncbi:MAG: F0F1 ATP synthase subunit B [Longimicrobiales bacterium]
MHLLASVVAIQEGGGLFSINTGVSIWTVVIFVALLLVLGKWAWGPILGALEAREARIREMIDSAARERAEAESVLEAHRRELAKARQHAQQIIGEGKQAAERVRQEMLNKARQEQEELVRRAIEDLDRERERAIEALRREAVDLSLAAAAKLVGKRLEGDEDRRLVSEFLARAQSGDGGGERADA